MMSAIQVASHNQPRDMLQCQTDRLRFDVHCMLPLKDIALDAAQIIAALFKALSCMHGSAPRAFTTTAFFSASRAERRTRQQACSSALVAALGACCPDTTSSVRDASPAPSFHQSSRA